MEKEMQEEKQQYLESKEKTSRRIHRVGTVTLGLILIGVGCLFLGHMFFPAITYSFIYKVWPIALIILGLEILLANGKSGIKEFVYDKTAIVLVAFLIMFTVLMAIIGVAMESERWYYQQQYAEEMWEIEEG